MSQEFASSDLLKSLRQMPIFCDCDETALLNLARACRVRRLPKDSVVFFQEDPGDALYLVLSGSVAILLNSQDGRELVINEVRAGDYFGELSLLIDQPRSASAITREKTELLAIPAEAFKQLLDQQPRVVRLLLVSTAQRLYASSARESALAFLDASGRVVRLLLQLDQENLDKGYMILSQEELAQRTGLTRQTVAKILGRWRRAGWLLTGRGRIMLLNREALQHVAEQSNL
jgi:CRP/FNR family transcriptional regulator/CRP/FNR family cyclic AMP-dependent transcriptional regulator